MGRGDKKTAKGKRSMGSYGNTRPKKKSTPVVASAPKAKAAKAEATEKKTTKKAAAPKAASEKKAPAKKTAKKSEE
jgi:ribosomal small subunit protein bTHX